MEDLINRDAMDGLALTAEDDLVSADTMALGDLSVGGDLPLPNEGIRDSDMLSLGEALVDGLTAPAMGFHEPLGVPLDVVEDPPLVGLYVDEIGAVEGKEDVLDEGALPGSSGPANDIKSLVHISNKSSG